MALGAILVKEIGVDATISANSIKPLTDVYQFLEVRVEVAPKVLCEITVTLIKFVRPLSQKRVGND